MRPGRRKARRNWGIATRGIPIKKEENMSRQLRRVLVVLVLAVGAVVATQAGALAAPPPAVGSNGEFLCPIVGDAVRDVADVANGDNGVSAIAPAPGVSLLPGGNQAGSNANSNALNDLPPNDPNAGPGGGNSGFGAIWPAGG